jgi:hypothetical protein
LHILSQNEELSVEKLVIQSTKMKTNHAFEELNRIFARYTNLESIYIGEKSEDNMKLLTQEGAKEIITFLDQDINEAPLKKLLEKDDYAEVK